LVLVFWESFASYISGVKAVHVATQGKYHLLPAAIGAPAGLRVYQVPGLSYFLLLRLRPRGSHRTHPVRSSAVAAQVFSPAVGATLPPIPFVEAELHMVTRYWSPVHEPLPLEQKHHVAVMHVAGHGQAGKDQEPYLLLGESQRLGLPELMRSGLVPEVAYLSACLVGRTDDDLEGEPVIGLLSGLFLRGTRFCIAPGIPVSDFHSPLLSALIHHALSSQTRRRSGLDVWGALAMAKEQLRSGVWPEDVVASVREHYPRVVESEIRRLYARGVAEFELEAMLSSWLSPACDGKDFQEFLLEVRMHGEGPAAKLIVDSLLNEKVRKNLHQVAGVKVLLRHMTVFGAPS